MPFLFPRWTNKVPLALALGAPVVAVTVVLAVNYYFSPKFTHVGYQPTQPVAFSHQLHAGDLGMDCVYCHNTVEEAAHAAIPPTSTCINCHASVGTQNPLLHPVREAWASGQPIEWVRVHQLPQHAFFDHSVHVTAGVGCASCHGQVDQMEVVRQEEPHSMGWCLNCHRDPEPHLRPRSEVTNMSYEPMAAGYDYQEDPDRVRDLNPPTHCSGCHR